MINNYYATYPNRNQYFYHSSWYQGTDPYVPSYFTNTSYSYPSSPHVSNSPVYLAPQFKISACQSIPEHQVTHQPFKCLWSSEGQQCQKSFANSEELGLHVREEHAEGRKICQWYNCGKEFKRPYKLVNHLPVHTGEKSFQCDTCGQAFGRKEHLKIHQRSHTGEKPFPCTHLGCDKRFRDSAGRTKHMDSHAEYHKNQTSKMWSIPTPIKNSFPVFSSYGSPEMNADTTQAVTGSIASGNCST
ncbi:hypothetical protein CRE_21307 [Caenorhabditis remanei]|uniref:C2H2-type domain-containing protein n=1 Tax=Caenorhabditis remanei TaxID=31234 RepID=E3MUL5_CAERE|nr:hypothetical protein CRE_21307 [Caenorhabditis remanei]